MFLGRVAESERLQKLREWCGTELERRYFRTVPETLPALDDADQVRADLEAAGLAIHFLGGADPAALDAIETSVAVCSGPTILYQPFGANCERSPAATNGLPGRTTRNLWPSSTSISRKSPPMSLRICRKLSSR